MPAAVLIEYRPLQDGGGSSMKIQRFRGLTAVVFAERLVSCFVPFLVLLTFIIAAMPAASGAQPACPPNGDVDQNGAVTAADALLAFQQALGLAQLDACQRSIADVSPEPADPDGSITASDALCIFQKALGLPSCLDNLPSANQPPVADAGPDRFVDAGVMVFLSGTATDPDGTIASHAWTQTGGAPVTLTGADAATAVFVAPDVSVDETLTFRLTVTDDAGVQATDEVMVTVHAVMAPPGQASAEEVFRQHVSGPVVQTKCINCHVANGASGHTRLVFVRSTDTPDHEAQNLAVFESFLVAAADEGRGSYVLNKIQGVGHGGGVQVSPGTPEFANMQQFLGLLGEEVAPPAPVTVETLFDTVIMASPRKTLRRAALIFAGRIPTEAEYAAVEGGDEAVLRATIRGLMEGPQFHEFLIRSGNDRLLTDRLNVIIDSMSSSQFVDLVNENYRRREIAYAIGDEGAWRDYWGWWARAQSGFRRAPLELVAHVVENDLPYTEVLTADYIMANPCAAAAYGASTRFDDPQDPHEFQPSRIVSYYRHGDEFEDEGDSFLGTRVLNPGSLPTNYPHAGILNTTSFLMRYPSTATNRNRARARWTYYHFLGLDVEKSASRTTDPVALADTDNPTMHNPACTVCHSILDPVAGAFQNYGDGGLYRDKLGGLDSLDDLYKEGKVAAMSVQATSWEDPQALVWPVTLSAGTKTLRVLFTNPFHHDEETDVAGVVWLDRLNVVHADGGVLVSHEFEDLEIPVPPWGGACGKAGDHSVELLWGERFCAFHIGVDVPTDGAYSIEVLAWSNGNHEQYRNDGFARLSVSTSAYQVGDTWFRDMRTPGFNHMLAPNPDNSVQWLARQIIADPRFAEATVKFWWPALMGSEVTQPPEVEGDAGFEGQLLAANAQGAEVLRLADDFRRGFHGGPAYNLKDLLVEIVLSKWFRADAVTDADPVRHVALHGAGAKRLLTPEELARKTAAITGVQWGRDRAIGWPYMNRWRNSLTSASGYHLLYGGIDSDGVTERGRDLTSVMAGVARRHAVAVSCPVVLREFYLVPEAERRLFAGIDKDVTGADAIRNKLVELQDQLLGVQVTPDSPDVEAAYRLFVEVMERARASGYDWFEWWNCNFTDDAFFEGILDNVWVLNERGGYLLDWDRVDAFMRDVDFSDPHATARAWKVVLAYLMMDDRYLYLY